MFERRRVFGSRVVGNGGERYGDGRVRVCACMSSSNAEGAGGGGSGVSPSSPARAAAARRQLLLKYVEEVQPGLIDQFMTRAPTEVVDAMRETVTSMIGTLPPQFFEVTVTTVAENLAQLMLSVMMTGYMWCGIMKGPACVGVL